MRCLTLNSNLMMNKIHLIQNDYRDLLKSLLSGMNRDNALEALDEINIFWIRHIKEVELYLTYWFSGADSYVFTAATMINYKAKEHLPFLLIGEKHVFDDPLTTYTEILSEISEGKYADFWYRQIRKTAEDNLMLLENIKEKIVILPLREFMPLDKNTELFELGDLVFLNLFEGIDSVKDFLQKCDSMEDVVRYFRNGLNDIIVFSENDNFTLPVAERFKLALNDIQHMINTDGSEAYVFYKIITSYLMQALDIINSCMLFNCVPYIRNKLTFHYILLLLDIMSKDDKLLLFRYKSYIAFVVCRLFDTEKFSSICLDKFIEKKNETNFYCNLLKDLESKGINETNFSGYMIEPIVISHLEKFYQELELCSSSN